MTEPINVEIIGGDEADGTIYAVRPGTRYITVPIYKDSFDPFLFPAITTMELPIETDGIHHWIIWPGEQ